MQRAGSSQDTREALFTKVKIKKKKFKKMRCLNIFSDTETDDFGEVSLMKEEQKNLAENIMFV